MAYPAYIREKARQLRTERKLTIDELAERLALPRTTIYYWVKDLEIETTESETLASRRAGEVSREMHARLRGAAYEQGKTEYPALSAEPTFRDFVCMYIGEGYKRNRNVVSICNSDPAVIRLGALWICRLAANPVSYSFQHHADQKPRELCAFWGELLGIDPATIRFQRKSNSGRLTGRTWRSKYGVLQVRASDAYLRARLEAWMDAVRGDWP
ncbi:MAG TPA: helix-turn-helix transcriptional regulator [Solirubrobacterales bacterium]|nr:helix-turn-helix transcriptional regulator [Solirubrobacterales bacterium]